MYREREREILLFRPETSWHVRWSVEIYLWGSGYVKVTWSRQEIAKLMKWWNGGFQKIRNSRFQAFTIAPLISSPGSPPDSIMASLDSDRNHAVAAPIERAAAPSRQRLQAALGTAWYRHNPRRVLFFQFFIFGVFPKCFRVLHRWICSLTLLHSVFCSCASSFSMCHEDFIVSLGYVCVCVCLTLRVLCAQLP